jgi:5-methylcytosine-specific restriction endonuclease McrA
MPYTNPEAAKAAQRKYYEDNRERLRATGKERQRLRRQSPEYREYLERTRAQRAEYKRRKRAEAGVKSRGSREEMSLRAAIKRAGRIPSVAQLVYQQQHEHWRNNRQDQLEHNRQRAKRNHQWRYLVDPSFRLYHRSKSKQRKAKERGSCTVMLSPDQMWRRWVEFDHRCAYCGASGDLQVEHVMPISKGGEHHLGNIVPACERCNYSKGRRDVEQWYRSQSFFKEARWLAIQSALAKGLPPAQLSLLE